MIEDMQTPLFIRSLTDNERSQIQATLRSKEAFVLRRAQVLMASDRDERATAIARQLGCRRQTVLNIIHGFNTAGRRVIAIH
jgi:predicted transcriptional regulator